MSFSDRSFFLYAFLIWVGLGVNTVSAQTDAATSESTEIKEESKGLNPFSRIFSSVKAMEQTLNIQEIKGPPNITQAIDLTVPPEDLWVRIRNGFAMPNLNDNLVLHYQQWYMNRPDALRRMVERSQPYLHHIVEEIELRGMPTELALLPMVESSFNPLAYSRAKASGLWQFIPATGKRFNLEQNWWHDQRRDVLASTEAALDYLLAIYEMQGDWHLALASYNWGEGAVKRAVEKNTQRGLPTDYLSLNMPDETRNYVPKLQALKNILGDPALLAQLKIPPMINRPYFKTIALDRPVDVKIAARLAQMPVAEFVALNPSHNRPIIRQDVPMVIPADRFAQFKENLRTYQGPLTEWQSYTIRAGERLDKLAPKFGIALSDLKRVNGLRGNIKLNPGGTLLVPGSSNAADVRDLPMLPEMADEEPVRKVEEPRSFSRQDKPPVIDDCQKNDRPTGKKGNKKSADKFVKSSCSSGKNAAKNELKPADKSGASRTEKSRAEPASKEKSKSARTSRAEEKSVSQDKSKDKDKAGKNTASPKENKAKSSESSSSKKRSSK